jgi:putative oxidoreductase
MTAVAPLRATPGRPERGYASTIAWLARVASMLAPLFLRVALAIPFLRSGLTKWEAPFVLSPGAVYLFESEFKLHLFGGEYGFPFPGLTAFLTASGEIVFPLLLVIGLATRLAALGILIMTAVIQLVVPGGWLTFHLPWAAMALALIAAGAGPLSLDRLIERRIGN